MSVDIVLADDHHLVRQGLRALLESEPSLRVVGEASDGLEVLPLVERHKPRLVIVDVKMPGLNGLDVTRQLRDRAPGIGVIVLSMHADEAYVAQALLNGASGYVLKESRTADLLEAVNAVVDGRRYLSPPLSEKSVESWIEKASLQLDPYETLSPREREVLQLAAEGRNNPEISERLGISPRTVESHRSNLMRKLSLKGQTELVRYAIKRGLLPG